MNFYFDENLPHQIASAFNCLEESDGTHKVFSTKIEFGEGVKDEDLIPKIGTHKGVLITKDRRMKSIRHQRELLKKYNLSVIFVYLDGLRYWDQVQKIMKAWPCIRNVKENPKQHFMYKVKRDGKLEQLN